MNDVMLAFCFLQLQMDACFDTLVDLKLEIITTNTPVRLSVDYASCSRPGFS
jgi:hypothetical protein